ncbi:ribonuclease H-like domain-containing protein [Schizophyllum commune]
MKCKFLQASHPELHAAINDVQAEEALGAKLADEEEISEPAKKKHHGEGTVEERCRDEGRARFQNEVNHAIMVFCCVCNIPLHALDTPQWKNLVCKLNPRYIPLSSNTFAEKYIPQEAALVKKKVVKILKKSRNLTVSFDGGSTRKDSVYFVHVTTPEREHFFIDGHVGTAEKHDAMWIYKRLKQVRLLDIHLVSAFVSDRASNAIGGRELMVKDDPVALDLGDSCHHLHNTSKDVSKLPEFGWMHKRLKATLAHFSKSTYSRAMLTASGEEEGEKVYALKKMGKTRFGSSRPSVVSLLAVLGHVRKLVQNGTISFKSKTLSALFSKSGRFAYSRLETALQQYADITEPICKAICALEASHATLSDVFIFFLAIAAHLHEQFNDPLSGISSKLADNVTTIFNDRFDQIFSEEHDEYFVCFALDPRKLVSPSAFIVIPRPGTDLSVTNPRAYDRVKQYLKDRLRTRIFPHYDRVLSTHGIDEVKRIYGPIHVLGKDGAIKALRTQLKDYWRREYPFHEDVTGGDSLAWWQKLIEHPRANVLAMLAIELFSILPNSMPDERTGSKFTWMNSALRGNQHATNLVYMVQIGQWYRRVSALSLLSAQILKICSVDAREGKASPTACCQVPRHQAGYARPDTVILTCREAWWRRR